MKKNEAPHVQVGILASPRIAFYLNGTYRVDSQEVTGEQVIAVQAGKLCWQGRSVDGLLFEPVTAQGSYFELHDVTIGIDFHWERKENQRFEGSLRFYPENEKVVAVNHVEVEAYLTSVISSEMSATASLELLKAHAVISRSWLLATMPIVGKHRRMPSPPHQPICTEEETLRWYERDAHTHFDVCADDHCQRYQGITRVISLQAKLAVEATRGEVLMHDNRICDARFSKCCGGVLEEFGFCWADEEHPYLSARRDCCETHTASTHSSVAEEALPNLCNESEAEAWIRSTPEAFCRTTDTGILSQVLNNYDQETTDFYRWRVSYTREELSDLVRRRSGIDYGDIIDLIPVARGRSGRLWKLRIVGSKRTRTIGKELEIRRTLSPSHLYSSAFVVDKEVGADGRPIKFTLIGAGWGHGVGLCQIGAAVMGEQGFAYDTILRHYYVGASIEKLY